MTGSAPVSITWIGHATVLVEVAGRRILTDPAVTPSLAHLRRRRPLLQIDPVDVIAISHLHIDHLHRASLRRVVDARTRLIAPTGALSLLRDLEAASVDEVIAGDIVPLEPDDGQVRIEAVHAEHSGRRGPHSKLVAPALGYVIRTPIHSVYFAGDTDLFDAMAGIGPLDIALLPIWGWGPTLGERHLDPDTAAEAVEVLGARRVIPIHWGTYSPRRVRPGSPPWLDNPLGAFRDALDARGLADRLVALLPGESTSLE